MFVFWNERTQKFNSVLKDVCVQKNVEFIDFDMNEDEWVKTCLYADGLHPNDNGYDLMADAVVGALKKKEMF
ncbi:MAG: hypothetical protein CMH32_03595 [Micavibrio sp.]|nr:hypothetical protein [Micavibrio sp.]